MAGFHMAPPGRLAGMQAPERYLGTIMVAVSLHEPRAGSGMKLSCRCLAWCRREKEALVRS